MDNNGFLEVRYYECGFEIPLTGSSMGAFRHRRISKGSHENAHRIIHCLNKMGVQYDNIAVEEWFDGGKVDILGKVNGDKKYIVVELGELSNIGKFSLPNNTDVKEFWFGDKDKFVYSLSRKASTAQKVLLEEGRSLQHSIVNYFKNYCTEDRLFYHCQSYSSAYSCDHFLKIRGIDFPADLTGKN